MTESDGSSTINYSYDSNGSLTSQTGRTQSWDLRGRLSGATVNSVTTSYRYTPDGIRSSVTEGSSTVDYIIDGMTPSGYQQVVEELSSGVLVVRYTYGASLDPISETRNGTSSLYLGDGHSGVRQAIDLAAAIVLAQRFDAFGSTVSKAGSLQTPIGYRGERFDATLGQYYLRARYYDPRSGRFTGVDPLAGNMSDPLQLMRYGYAGNNPVWGIDPSGSEYSISGLAISIGISVSLKVGIGIYHGETSAGQIAINAGIGLLEGFVFYWPAQLVANLAAKGLFVLGRTLVARIAAARLQAAISETFSIVYNVGNNAAQRIPGFSALTRQCLLTIRPGVQYLLSSGGTGTTVTGALKHIVGEELIPAIRSATNPVVAGQIPSVVEALAIREIQAALIAAEQQGIVYGRPMIVGSSAGSTWELIFSNTGIVPKLYHM